MSHSRIQKRLYVVNLKIAKANKERKFTAYEKLALGSALAAVTFRGPYYHSQYSKRTLLSSLDINYLQGVLIGFGISMFLLIFILSALRFQYRTKIKRLQKEKQRLENLLNT